VDSAVEKSGNLFGDNLQDSRVNNAARGDGMAVIETWIFSPERFKDSAREAARDFVRNGAGWLCQTNWKGGIETLRLGTMAAADIRASTATNHMPMLKTESEQAQRSQLPRSGRAVGGVGGRAQDRTLGRWVGGWSSAAAGRKLSRRGKRTKPVARCSRH
jgi:hypothetical protein